jgi:hypothetical protein
LLHHVRLGIIIIETLVHADGAAPTDQTVALDGAVPELLSSLLGELLLLEDLEALLLLRRTGV